MNVFPIEIFSTIIRFFIAFLVVFAPSISKAQSEERATDWERLKLNGKVKSSILDMKRSFDLETFRLPDLFYSYYFDKNGYITEEYDNTNHSFRNNKYNKNNQIRSIEAKNIKNKLSWLYLYEYNLRGDLIKEKVYMNDKLSYINIIIYDQKGRKISKERYDKEGKIQLIDIYRYNKDGLLFNSIVYVAVSGIYYHSLWKHNDKGKVLQRFSSASKKETGKRKWKLDHEYTYDANGNLLQETNYYLDSSTIINYKRDEDDNEIEERIYTGDNKSEIKKVTTKVEYKYDSQNNWIQKSIYKNGKLKIRLVRNIEYYDEN